MIDLPFDLSFSINRDAHMIAYESGWQGKTVCTVVVNGNNVTLCEISGNTV